MKNSKFKNFSYLQDRPLVRKHFKLLLIHILGQIILT